METGMASGQAQLMTLLGVLLIANGALAGGQATLSKTQNSTPATLSTTQNSTPATLSTTQNSTPATLSKTQNSTPATLSTTQNSTPATLSTTQNSTQAVPEELALRALYWNFPPFAKPSESTDAPAGVMSQTILGKFIPQCLTKGSQIIEWTKMTSPRDVHENRAGYDIIFPISRTSNMASMKHSNSLYQFIPFIESPGVAVLRCSANAHSAVYSSILGTWPLGLALVSTAVLAGIIIWVLDTYWNPEGFPQPFSTGLWEGVWWAWVTMSTVGYGDKTPKGPFGRVFAYLWILVGIIFMSIFTAAVTTAISEDLSSIEDVTGEKVGVINGTTDEWLALSQGAEVTVYEADNTIWSAVKDGTLDAVLMDSLRVISEMKTITSMGVSQKGTIYAPSVHGVLLYNMTSDVIECFSQLAEKYSYKMYDAIKGMEMRMKKQDIQDSTTALFVGSDSVWIYVLVGVVLGLIVILLTGECIYVKFIKRKGVKIGEDPGVSKKEKNTSPVP